MKTQMAELSRHAQKQTGPVRASVSAVQSVITTLVEQPFKVLGSVSVHDLL